SSRKHMGNRDRAPCAGPISPTGTRPSMICSRPSASGKNATTPSCDAPAIPPPPPRSAFLLGGLFRAGLARMNLCGARRGLLCPPLPGFLDRLARRRRGARLRYRSGPLVSLTARPLVMHGAQLLRQPAGFRNVRECELPDLGLTLGGDL